MPLCSGLLINRHLRKNGGYLTKDLRQYLNTHFQKGSENHHFQNAIKDNLHPLQYNHYDTTNSMRESSMSMLQQTSSIGNVDSVVLPDTQPFSEGKEQQHSLNAETTAAKNTDPTEFDLLSNHNSARPSTPQSLRNCYKNLQDMEQSDSLTNLGSLPENWEIAYTEFGEVYFIDHNHGTSQWLDPRLTRIQKKAIQECHEDELPYGWEKINDPHYGTYFIDHVNRRTQYENPVLHAKYGINDGCTIRCRSLCVFTTNPEELKGEIHETSLVKSSQGFGFTIVGGDNGEEFLQIKSVVQNGPAWKDGKLQTGDVLVYLNDKCVLGLTPEDMVELFQSIPPGNTVHLEVCRGYPLPFDPNDPDTEIVTTDAVTACNTLYADGKMHFSGLNKSKMNNSQLSGVEVESVGWSSQSVTDLSTDQVDQQHSQRYNCSDLQNSSEVGNAPDILDFNPQSPHRPELLTLEIIKGDGGFGFTIADSAYGQKVKKILDKQRCKLLQEGDILVKIGNQDITGLTHAKVVQLLKDFLCGDQACITIRRGGSASPIKGKEKVSKNPGGIRKSANSSISHSLLINFSEGHLPSVSGAHRSKTPTADLYRSKDKETIYISRPKTPLVDSRNWERSTNSEILASCDSENVLNARTTGNMSVTSCDKYNTYSGMLKEMVLSGSSTAVTENTGSGDHSQESYWNDHSCTELGMNTSEEDREHELLYACTSHHNGNFNRNIKLDLKNPIYSNIPSSHSERSDNEGFSTLSYHSRTNVHSCGDMDNQDLNCIVNNSKTANNRSSSGCSNSSNKGLSNNRTLSYRRNGSISGEFLHEHSPRDYFQTLSGEETESVYSTVPSNKYRVGSQNDSQTQQKYETSTECEQPEATALYCAPRDTISTYSRPSLNSFGATVPRSPPLGWSTDFLEMTITLVRKESGFGFRIVGGTEEDSQVSVGHIVPGGAADMDGRLHSGDEIVFVDSQVVISASHHQVVQLVRNAALSGRVTLRIRRRVSSLEPLNHTKSTEKMYPYDITLTRKENEGFGFVIISSVGKAGSAIGRIVQQSPAEHCGELQVGDYILAINGISILNMHHEEIVGLIKASGCTVVLTIGPPQGDTSSTTSSSQRGDEQSTDHVSEYYSVELHRGSQGYGFSIRGGKEFKNMPLFVLRIAENGPAQQDNRLQVGDQLIEINGINTKNMTHGEATELIRQSNNSVRLLVKRGANLPCGFVDQPSPLNISASAMSSLPTILNGPISQSSPRGPSQSDGTMRNVDLWNYDIYS
ncbi:membrane-associated guanylate kinase, WW and PDZ domain-containing protein 1-like isoform X2 [Limulus polyphemus]|uniref:Membrane-associated guanylate kinase, WW and PDZ domain-containing protein 1-like isoform X2 n=1 Tax=Limulus polyphemus TaxID=6850 RepID=A0ABM1S0Q7_LIMPO|nr:membrane-associated guanylate kinase, WW and PDZ domain-containing protein 1-like isoform X2 [Limulus polyphemus]